MGVSFLGLKWVCLNSILNVLTALWSFNENALGELLPLALVTVRHPRVQYLQIWADLSQTGLTQSVSLKEFSRYQLVYISGFTGHC